jgi:hypothetical protein
MRKNIIRPGPKRYDISLSGGNMKTEEILKRLRIFLLGFSVFIFAGATVELLALKHFGEDAQWLPLFLCPLGIILVALFLAKPGKGLLNVLRIGMWGIAAGGLVGTFIHVSGNLERIFEAGQSVNLPGLFYDSCHVAGSNISPPGWRINNQKITIFPERPGKNALSEKESAFLLPQ